MVQILVLQIIFFKFKNLGWINENERKKIKNKNIFILRKTLTNKVDKKGKFLVYEIKVENKIFKIN
jgi:hypothetical protein